MWTAGRKCTGLLTVFVLMALLGSVAQGEDAAQPPQAEDEIAAEWTASIESTLNGKYVWRGINVVDGAVFQPSLTLGRGGFSANAWGNMDITNDNGQDGNFTEIDLTLDYSWAWKAVNFSAGAIYYTFPHGSAGASTTELYGSAGLNCLLSPTVTVYEDVDEASGTYGTFSVGHGINLGSPAEGVSVGLELSASAAYSSSDFNAFYYGPDESGFADGLVSVGLPIGFDNGLSVTPALNYSSMLDSDLEDALEDDSNFWAGVTVGYSF